MSEHTSKRRRVEVDAMIEFLEDTQLIDTRAIKKQGHKDQDLSKFKMRRIVPPLLKALIIYLRHGSLHADDHIVLKWGDIALRCGVKLSTCCEIVRRWAQHGFKLDEHRLRRKPGKKSMVTPEILLHLSEYRVLREMSHLNLEQRALIIKQKFQLKSFSSFTLRQCYQRCGIKYRRTPFNYLRKEHDSTQLKEAQLQRSKELAQLMMHKTRILYLDETSFHKWQMKPRTWLLDNMTMTMPSDRGQSVTVIGAIDAAHGLVHYKLVKGSNNGDVFKQFLHELKIRVLDDAVIVMDNLPVHRSKKVMAEFDERHFKAFFLPPYSCVLNPIERLWALIKGRWRRHNMMVANTMRLEETVDQGVDQLRVIIESLEEIKVRNICRSHHRSMVQALKGHLI